MAPVLGKDLPRRGKRRNGPGHVVQGLEDRHQVVPARPAEIGGVSD